MRPFDRARATLGDLIDAMQNDQLPGVRHGERRLFLARNLLFLGQAESVAIPDFALLQVSHLDSNMTGSVSGTT